MEMDILMDRHRIIARNNPAMTIVELWRREDTGVGADIAYMSHDEKGN
jgi:hypothetical protein